MLGEVWLKCHKPALAVKTVSPTKGCPAWCSQEVFLVQMPDDAADPAQDPNNQGEDEFEEAELERPDFEEKAGDLEKFKEPSVQEESREKPLKVTDLRTTSWGDIPS